MLVKFGCSISTMAFGLALWMLDDVTFAAASDDEKTSELKLPEDLPKNLASNRPTISPQLAKALQEAENAPT